MDSMELRRNDRRTTRKETIRNDKLVESVNSLSCTAFIEQFNVATSIDRITSALSSHRDHDLKVDMFSAIEMKSTHRDFLDACFRLIEESSADDYKASEIKWSPTKKRREMILPDMKYFIVRKRTSDSSNSSFTVEGFVSFMVTYEDGLEVVYIYEIHLAPHLRSQGVGKLLMQMLEEMGEKVGVEKCMLTVFRTNEKAVAWYHHRGYVIDEFSPQPRILRNGSVKEPSYLILSKPLQNSSEALHRSTNQ